LLLLLLAKSPAVAQGLNEPNPVMGKKRGAGGGQHQQHADNDGASPTKREHPLQAVVLADSFARHFRPLSLDRPKVLCPLNNVPMIDYALEFLAGAGVREAFVVCASDRVERYCETKYGLGRPLDETAASNAAESSSPTSQSHHHRAGGSGSNMQVTVILDASLTNAGDALREVDKRNLVQSDPFVLMFGDVVANVDLTDVIRVHKERHKRDSSAIMTLLMKPIGPSSSSEPYDGNDGNVLLHNPVRQTPDDLVVGLDPTRDNRVLVYDNDASRTSVSVPCSFLASHPYVDLRTDLLDCGIDVCSPDVLARMADEFDYRDIRREFVANSVAEEEEGLQNKVYAHLLGRSEYAARAHDVATYHCISRDLLRRWCHPVVPDNLPAGYENKYRYTMQRRYLYVESSNNNKVGGHRGGGATKTRIGRSSKVKGPGMVGSNCRIGERCVIESTVVGNLCHVDDAVTLVGSHLWDAVHVGKGATVRFSVLADGCVVKPGAVVDVGCVVGAGCVIGENVVLPAYTRVTLKEETSEDFEDDWGDDDDDEDTEEDANESGDDNDNEPSKSSTGEFKSDVDVVGADGKGRVWKPSPDAFDLGEDDEHSPDDLAMAVKARSLGFDPTELLIERYRTQRLKEQEQHNDGDDFSDYSDALVDMEAKYGEYADGGNVTFEAEPAGAGDSAPVIIGRQKGVDVVKELKLICLEYEPTSPIENLAIELNSFKFSQNASYSDCTMAATLAILEKMDIRPGMGDAKLVADFKSSLDHWAPLLRKMSIGLDEEKAIVLAVERCATQPGTEMAEYLGTGTSFRFLLQTLHDEEIVSEEAILSWAADRREGGNAADVNIAEVEAGDAENGTNKSAAAKLFQLKPVQDFLEWLAEESEEDSDEDDDDEEGGDGERD